MSVEEASTKQNSNYQLTRYFLKNWQVTQRQAISEALLNQWTTRQVLKGEDQTPT
jgi:hypothetical protein